MEHRIRCAWWCPGWGPLHLREDDILYTSGRQAGRGVELMVSVWWQLHENPNKRNNSAAWAVQQRQYHAAWRSLPATHVHRHWIQNCWGGKEGREGTLPEAFQEAAPGWSRIGNSKFWRAQVLSTQIRLSPIWRWWCLITGLSHVLPCSGEWPQ